MEKQTDFSVHQLQTCLSGHRKQRTNRRTGTEEHTTPLGIALSKPSFTDSGGERKELQRYFIPDIMNRIIADDEPLAREAIEFLVKDISCLTLTGTFNNAASAAKFMNEHPVDLLFLDIQMPGITGIEFARTIPKKTLIIFTTAYTEYALDSYEVDAIDCAPVKAA